MMKVNPFDRKYQCKASLLRVASSILIGTQVLHWAQADSAIQNHVEEQGLAQHLIKDHGIHAGTNFADHVIHLKISPENWHIYSELQEKIATIIPKENERPTIDLTVSNALDKPVEASIGIAGGTGPLSDSELLGRIMNLLNESKLIDWDHFAIHLYSAPPPRSLSEAVFRPSYVLGMNQFASLGHSRYYLASNTAHLNIGTFRRMVGTSPTGGDPVVDLANYVAVEVSKLAAGEPEPRVLVLGTFQAFERHLYPNYLARQGMAEDNSSRASECSRCGKFHVLETEEKAKHLQGLIDLAKSGHVDAAGAQISDFILKEVAEIHAKGGIINKVILGCTELPMALKGPLLNHLNAEIQKQFGEQVTFVNTEELFAQKIAQDIQFLSQNSPHH